MRAEWWPSATAPSSLHRPIADKMGEAFALEDWRAKAIVAVLLVGVAVVLWWQVFQFTEASWWGFRSEHAKKAPPRAPRIKLLGLESIDLDKALQELSQKPSHMGNGAGGESQP